MSSGSVPSSLPAVHRQHWGTYIHALSGLTRRLPAVKFSARPFLLRNGGTLEELCETPVALTLSRLGLMSTSGSLSVLVR
jgi:hypothetical protein